MMALCYCWCDYQWKETDDNEDGGGDDDAVNRDADDADVDGDVVDNNDSYHVVNYIMMG